MKRIRTILLAATTMILSVGFLITSSAATQTAASGTIGTCKWDVNSNGVMTIHSGTIDYDDSIAADNYFQDMWGYEYFGYMFEDPEYREVWDDETGEPLAEEDVPEEIADLPMITKVRTDGKVTVKNAAFLFHGFSSVEEFDLSGFSTSGVTMMNYMFNGCYELKSIDISMFDTSSVTTMDRMFDSCSMLESIDVSGLDTSNVTNMFGLFEDCYSLRSADLSSFNTAKVTDMAAMFYGCENLEYVDLSSFRTVGNASWMFKDCAALREIKCGNWNEDCNAEFPVDMVKTSTGELYQAEELIPTGKGLTFVIPDDYSGTIQPRKDMTPVTIDKSSATVAKGKSLKLIATGPKNAAIKWKTSNKKIANVDKNGKVTAKGIGDATITAYTSNNKKATCKISVRYKITYKLNEGKNSSKNPTWHKKGVALKNPTREGYIFKGWYTDKNFKKKNKIKKVGKTNQTVYAKWASKKVSVSFDANGGKAKKGSSLKTITVNYGKKYGTLPSMTNGKKVFMGWYTQDGTRITSKTVVNKTKAHSLKAQWEFKVTLSSIDNSYCEKNSIKVSTFGSYNMLPTPVRAGYTFKGWWTTASKGGTQVKKSTPVTGSDFLTLYPRWQARPDVTRVTSFNALDLEKADKVYDIIKNGSVSAAKDGAKWYYIFTKDNQDVLIPVDLLKTTETWSIPAKLNEVFTEKLNENKSSMNRDFLIKKTTARKVDLEGTNVLSTYTTTVKSMQQAYGQKGEDGFFISTTYDSDIGFIYSDKIKPQISDGSFKDFWKTPSTPDEYMQAFSRTTATPKVPLKVHYNVIMKNPDYYNNEMMFANYEISARGVAEEDVNLGECIKTADDVSKVLETILGDASDLSYKSLFDLFDFYEKITKRVLPSSEIFEFSGKTYILSGEALNENGEYKLVPSYAFIVDSPIYLENAQDYIEFKVFPNAGGGYSTHGLAGTNTVGIISISED